MKKEIKKGQISRLHSDINDALEYFSQYGYYMVDCPFCNEVVDSEIDAEKLTCISCGKEFEVESI